MATRLPTIAATPNPETVHNAAPTSDAPAKATVGPDTTEVPRRLDRRIADRRQSATRVITARFTSPSETDDPTNSKRDQLAAYQRLIVVGRWCSLLVSAIALLTVPGERTSTNSLFFAAFAVLTTFRSFRPIRHWGFELGAATSIVTELSITILAVCFTGYWQSPLAFMLLPGILVGAFSQGGPLVVGYGSVTSLIISFLELRYHPASTQESWRQSWQWSIQIVAFAVVAGLARKVVHDALVRQSTAVESMARLTSANGLLFALHKVAQSLPSSLDLEDVAMSTIANARELFPCDAITILLRDETMGVWEVLRAEGVRLPATLDPVELPVALALASRSTGPIRLCDLPAGQRQTLLRGAQSGLYVPLRARQSSAGILAIERAEPGADTSQLAELLRRFAEPASIAIDNARWFGRIRRVAADEERVRIARDLHDRIGQSLAYVGFELDRLGKHPEAAPLSDELSRLRIDVRRVISEVRETLYDIRTDVNVDRDASATIEGFLERVRDRNPNLEVLFEQQTIRPLPTRQEREMWLIAQEAIVNVERHARATVLRVRWYCNGTQAVVEVIDNGRGFAGAAGRVDSYGLRGLQERAAAIGARLEIESRPDQGTVVRCRLE